MTNDKMLIVGLGAVASVFAMISGLLVLIVGVYEPAIVVLLVSIQGTLIGMRLDALERRDDG